MYNNWEQVDGYDDMYGHGGICDDIAGAISNVLNENGLDSTTIYDEHDFHTCAYVIDYEKQYMIQVDIHHSYYEKGSAYTWIKIPNVKFNEDMLSINDMSSYYENYFDEEGNMYDI